MIFDELPLKEKEVTNLTDFYDNITYQVQVGRATMTSYREDLKYGFLGASSNGLVGEDSLVEVKCIYIKSDVQISSIDDVIDLRRQQICLQKTEGGIRLKHNNSYYLPGITIKVNIFKCKLKINLQHSYERNLILLLCIKPILSPFPTKETLRNAVCEIPNRNLELTDRDLLQKILQKQNIITGVLSSINEKIKNINDKCQSGQQDLEMTDSIFNKFDFPINSDFILSEFEQYLKNENEFNKTVKVLLKLRVSNEYHFVSRIMEKIITNSLASHYSYLYSKLHYF
ncbi:hypothetical protein RN001_014334 [Aquatica leii]|uniref:Uncharacterized protein n=1 Tax=Aquatica leii TaxID=1421715 RepID=A0AAN7P1F7_9COLE|nr:hypothetical protein RN001_014334 [Aquatica leii]